MARSVEAMQTTGFMDTCEGVISAGLTQGPGGRWAYGASTVDSII